MSPLSSAECCTYSLCATTAVYDKTVMRLVVVSRFYLYPIPSSSIIFLVFMCYQIVYEREIFIVYSSFYLLQMNSSREIADENYL